MYSIDFHSIFSSSFDTFRIFDNLSIKQASLMPENTPKSIWQILNHLVVFQDRQLEQLFNNNYSEVLEGESWLVEPEVNSQPQLNELVKYFYRQILQIQQLIDALTLDTPLLARKLKLIQEMSTHLSFHLGEIVLIRRQMKNYPWPDEMKAFFAKEG